MDPRKRKFITIVALLAGILIGLAMFIYFTRTPKKQPKAPVQPSVSLPDPHPPQEVLSVVAQYIQARENDIGANQASTTSWLTTVQSITTADWFAKLQPIQNGSTGSASAEYNTAHRNGYIVKSELTKCIWNFKLTLPTPTSGAVYCELNDTTINQSTGEVITGTALPFGWSRTGQQNPITLKVTKESGTWLISEDAGSEPD